jgi:hypothetical protein
MANIVTGQADDYYLMDLRKECFSPKVYSAPTPKEGRAVGTFQGQMIVCGGRNTDNDAHKDSCAFYNAIEGWISAGNLPHKA